MHWCTQAVLCLLVLAVTVPDKAHVSAECCWGVCGNICADCSIGTPYCAYGKCNVFGCNCDDGCRRNAPCRRPCPMGKRSVHDLKPQPSDHVQAIMDFSDHNKDGRLNVTELKSYLENHERVHLRREARNAERHFADMDSNGDGFLSRQEIDK